MGETSCVTWGKCLNLSESRFLHLSSRSQGLGRYLHTAPRTGAPQPPRSGAPECVGHTRLPQP